MIISYSRISRKTFTGRKIGSGRTSESRTKATRRRAEPSRRSARRRAEPSRGCVRRRAEPSRGCVRRRVRPSRVGSPGELDLILACPTYFDSRIFRIAANDTHVDLEHPDISHLILQKFSADQVCYIKYPRVRNRDDPWVTVTRLNPRGRVQGSSELEDPLQPSTSGNLSAAEDLAGVGLVVDLTDFGEEAVVHVEDELVIGEFHQDPDSDSSGDDDSETD
ncbi:hypothetical protein DY000_02033051 [Brassica cretica]|uniref:DUF4216 domain-containing protein n=1 Tax=Brassica cretica TaxID=69181 RepID=A0ABQ7DMV1_BRACR|nr:hypothetical protein DY000_02033051 [Brassica cretica]